MPSTENELSSRKRKGRPPIKNLKPITKRSSSVGSPRTSVDSVEEVPVKRKRGRPAKNKDPSQVGVKVPRLSPNQVHMAKTSPVKVMQENPLVLQSVEKRVSDDEDEGPPKVDRKLDFDSVEIIESSQSSNETRGTPSRGRKRKRESTTLSENNPKVPPPALIEKPSPVKGRRSLSFRGQKDKENLTESSNSTAPPVAVAKNKQTNQYGESPLHVAVRSGNLAKVEALLEKNADVHAKDNAGWLPIHEAFNKKPDAVKIVKALLNHGTDVNAQVKF